MSHTFQVIASNRLNIIYVQKYGFFSSGPMTKFCRRNVPFLRTLNSAIVSEFPFLPRDAMRKRGLSCGPVSVCPSVCLSVTSVHSIQAAEDIVKLLCRSGIPSF